MKYNKILIHNFLLIQGLLLIILQCVGLNATPICKNLSIRYGTSPQINRYSWATLSCYLGNPDTKKSDIEIRLVDNISGVYRQKTIFSDQITVPSETELYYQTAVMLENAEEYSLELFHNGVRIGETSSSLIKLSSRKSHPLAIFNDSPGTNFGSFLGLDSLGDVYHPTFFSAATPFNKWQLLINSPFIVMMRPNYSEYSSEKFQAILSYVKQGGTIIFADPEGLKAAIKTPLAPLIPIRPLRQKKVQKLPELSNIIPSFKSFAKPVTFLESIPNGDGVTLVRAGQFPLIRYKRFGMGGARAIVIPATSDAYRSRGEWKVLIGYLFSHQNLLNNTTPVKGALDEMTGFTIPGTGSIRWIIFLYFFIIAIPLGLGQYFKKTAAGWITAGLLATAFTVTMLYTSLSGAGVHKKDFLSFIEIVTPGRESISGIGYYGIMSASDKRIDITANNENVLFSSIPPSKTKVFFMGNSSNTLSPLEIKTVNGLSGIKSMNLPVNSPRHFYSSFQGKRHSQKVFKLPQLTHNTSGISFLPWQIPKDFVTPEAAWIQFPSGKIELTINNRTLSIKKGGGVFHSNVINQKIKEFTTEGFKHTSPLLFLLNKADKASTFSIKNTIIHGKRISVIPVSEIFNTDKIVIRPEELSFTAGDTSTRLIMSGNKIKPEIFSRAPNTYLFKFQLPPYIINIKPKQIECEFSYINDSGNIKIEPFLAVKKSSKKSASLGKNKIIRGEKDKNGVFIFSETSGVIDSSSGSALIGLEVKLKNINIPLGAQKKTNTWRLEKFRITIKGTIPKFKDKFIY